MRTENNEIFTSTEWGDNNGKEIVYKTYKDAEESRSKLQPSFLDVKLKIVKVVDGDMT